MHCLITLLISVPGCLDIALSSLLSVLQFPPSRRKRQRGGQGLHHHYMEGREHHCPTSEKFHALSFNACHILSCVIIWLKIITKDMECLENMFRGNDSASLGLHFCPIFVKLSSYHQSATFPFLKGISVSLSVIKSRMLSLTLPVTEQHLHYGTASS